MVPEKAPAKIAACNAADNSPKFNQATDWPRVNMNVINNLDRNSESNNRAETRSRYGATDLSVFPSCPLRECLPLACFPSTPAPNSTLQHCYTTFIMLLS